MRPGVLGEAHFFQCHGQVEVRVGVERIEAQRFPITGLRVAESSEVVVDVAEVEMGLEEIRVEADRPFIECLCLAQLVPAVVDVRKIDQRGNQ